ncbi:MAG: hypothetical protein R2827_11790 [Bdellovibrionales bacterium]
MDRQQQGAGNSALSVMLQSCKMGAKVLNPRGIEMAIQYNVTLLLGQ